MVKHRRRRATTKKVSRKSSGNKQFFKAVQQDPMVAKRWNFRASRTENMKNLGLADDVNAVKPAQEKTEFVEMALLKHPQSDDLERSATNPRRTPLTEEKQRYIAKLLKKHGHNYDAMAADIKLNVEQLTLPKLKKLATKFLNLPNDRRAVKIPKNLATTPMAS